MSDSITLCTDQTIRVLIVDDHPLFRHGVHGLLDVEDNIIPVGEVSSVNEAIDWLALNVVDVVLLDHNLPGINGIYGLPMLLNVQRDLQVIILTVCDGDEEYLQAIRFGACGYLLKDAEPQRLIDAVRLAATHECQVPERLISALTHQKESSCHEDAEHSSTLWPDDPSSRSRANTVTVRELELLQQLCHGLSNKEIARELKISPNTVRNQLQRLQERFGVGNRVQLALLAKDKGYI